MHGDVEALSNSSGYVSSAQRGIIPERLPYELQNRRTELACLFGAALEWNETRQTTLRKRGLGLIERRPRETKIRRGFGNRLPIFLDAAQHLVLDLNQVAAVEKLAAREQIVGHRLRARVERTLFAEITEFGILGRWWFGHERFLMSDVCKADYVLTGLDVKPFMTPQLQLVLALDVHHLLCCSLSNYANAAQLSLHIRRYYLYTARPVSTQSRQQIRQSDQILIAKEGAPGGDLYERIDASDIRAVRHNRLQLALGATEEHAILAPGFLIFDQFEFATEQWMEGMRYPEMFRRTALMRCN